MDIDTFWWDDEDYFKVYVKSYNDRIKEKAWLTGFYTLKAVEHAIVEVLPSAVWGNKKLKHEKFRYPNEPIENYKRNIDNTGSKVIEVESKDEKELNEKVWGEQLLAFNDLI